MPVEEMENLGEDFVRAAQRFCNLLRYAKSKISRKSKEDTTNRCLPD